MYEQQPRSGLSSRIVRAARCSVNNQVTAYIDTLL